MVLRNTLKINVFDELKFSDNSLREICATQEKSLKVLPELVFAYHSITRDWTPSLARSPNCKGLFINRFYAEAAH